MAPYVAPLRLSERDCSVVKVSVALPQDVQAKLRDAYKRTGDEFMTNRIATQAKVCRAFIENHKLLPVESCLSFW